MFRMSLALHVRAFSVPLRKLGLRRLVVVREWRRHTRHQVAIDGELDGAPCHIVDLSRGGARVVLRVTTAPEVGDRVTLSFSFEGRPFRLQGHARRAAGDVLHRSVGIEFSQGQEDVLGELEALLRYAIE